MEFETFLPYVVAGGVVAAVWGVAQYFQQGDDRTHERLDVLNGNRERKGPSGKGVTGALEMAAPKLSQALGEKSAEETNNLKIRLANAGYNHELAPQIYLSLKVITLLVGAVLGGGLGLWQYGLTQNGYTTLGISAGVAFYVPEIFLWYVRSKRMQNIWLSLPDVLDLLVVCVEAGLGLDAGMRKIQEEMKDAAPELCDELAIANMQSQIGRSRRDVLHDLGVRTGVDDIKALVAILIQAERFGSSIAQALRVQSESMRVKRRQIAEEKAQATAVQMLFPLVLFIFPGIFVVLVGPAAIKMIDQMLSMPV